MHKTLICRFQRKALSRPDRCAGQDDQQVSVACPGSPKERFHGRVISFHFSCRKFQGLSIALGGERPSEVPVGRTTVENGEARA